MEMKLAIGPVQYYWPRATVLDFYRAVAAAPVDIVYLGETVCSRRHELRFPDWLDVAESLAAAGKQVVLSTLALIESESDLKALRKVVANDLYAVEANDMGAVRLLSGRPFVAGASLNLYNAASIRFIAACGATRWVTPNEMSQKSFETLKPDLPPGMETELMGYGRHSLAHSARCFTARRFNLQKDACEFKCMDFPEGLLARTREQTPLFVLNGLQTQSARICNLVRALPAMFSAGIDVVRINPIGTAISQIAELFARALEHLEQIETFALALEQLTDDAGCDGFWHGEPGMARRTPAAHA